MTALTTSLNGADPRLQDWGLCRAAYEKDSCGFGLIASLDDQRQPLGAADGHQFLEPTHPPRRHRHRRQDRRRLRPVDQAAQGVFESGGRGRRLQFGAAVRRRFGVPGSRSHQGRCRARGTHGAITAGNAAGGGLSLTAHRPIGLRFRGAQDFAAYRAGVRERRQRHRRGHLQSQIVFGAAACRKGTGSAGPGFLHALVVGQHHRLQRHGDAAISGAILSGPQGSADGSLGGGVPSALFHQHLAAMAACTSLSILGAQR